MIAYIRGKLVSSTEDQVWIDTGGVAYEISVHQRFLAQLPPHGAELIVYTHYQSLENEVRLYGFVSTSEQALFKKIITVSGFGTKAAMSILSAMNPQDFITAVLCADEKRLTTIPGIGKKTAQRLVFELKDRLGAFGSSPQIESTSALRGSSQAEDLLDALEALGYGRSEVFATVAEVLAESGEDAKVESTLRQVLKRLAR